MFWYVTEWLLIVLVFAFVITQIILPIITNKPMFNIFKFKKEDRVKSELILEIEKKEVEKEIHELKENLRRKK